MRTCATIIAGAILAGGKGSRIGGAKAMAPLLGMPMIAHVAAILRGAATPIAIIGDEAAACVVGSPFLADVTPGRVGPLAGLLTALEWAEREGASWLTLAPCDAPLLPHDVFARLLTAAGSDAPAAYAVTAEGPEPLVSVWRIDTLSAVRAAALSEYPAIWSLADRLRAIPVRFDSADDFLNVNSPEDLARAEQLLSSRGFAPAQPPRQS